MCDQLRAFEVGCYGNPVIRTPKIDRLAAYGVRVTHAVSNNPYACPLLPVVGAVQPHVPRILGHYSKKLSDGTSSMLQYPEEERQFLLDPTMPAEGVSTIWRQTPTR